MGAVREAGPWRTVTVDGADVPYYVLPFDRTGTCTAPATRSHLLEAVRTHTTTDVYLFSHGWNNDWDVADDGGLYDRFMAEFLRIVTAKGRPRPRTRTALVGIFWPSMALSGNTGPRMAASGRVDAEAAARDAVEAALLADEVIGEHDRRRFYDLLAQSELNEGGARELASMLLPLYQLGADDFMATEDRGADELDHSHGVDQGPRGADEAVDLWRLVSRAASSSSGYDVVTGLPPDGDGNQNRADDEYAEVPVAAGLLNTFDPRWIVRGASVLVMKDRAGRVGATGVRQLLHDLVCQVEDLRVHLIGHSYGCRVVLSALAAQPPPRPVHSVLLLQPALSYLAFAHRISGTGQAGGYRAALERTELPVAVTYSRRDIPLRRLFHLGVRRRSDIGEQAIGVAARDVPRSRCAAMGGWGPAGLDSTEIRHVVMRRVEDGPYDVPAAPVKVLALEGHELIHGHGHVATEATAWALYGLAAASSPAGDDRRLR